MLRSNKYLALGIAGSPRPNGNSTSLLKSYLEGTESEGFETKIVFLNHLKYRGCQACDRCVQGKDCSLKDDLCEIFPLLQKAKIWAMASPVYYDGVSGQLKAFFDRLRFTTYDPYKLKGPRRGIVIVTYVDATCQFYEETATRIANYFSYNKRGDFGEVRVIAQSNLGPRNAWKKRPDLQEKLKEAGKQQAAELNKLLEIVVS